ncbi:MAG: hypothetical protein AVDCRST_MAG13-1140, partial [uncultured Solirubrobacteraceae bacterium]
ERSGCVGTPGPNALVAHPHPGRGRAPHNRGGAHRDRAPHDRPRARGRRPRPPRRRSPRLVAHPGPGQARRAARLPRRRLRRRPAVRGPRRRARRAARPAHDPARALRPVDLVHGVPLGAEALPVLPPQGRGGLGARQGPSRLLGRHHHRRHRRGHRGVLGGQPLRPHREGARRGRDL